MCPMSVALRKCQIRPDCIHWYIYKCKRAYDCSVESTLMFLHDLFYVDAFGVYILKVSGGSFVDVVEVCGQCGRIVCCHLVINKCSRLLFAPFYFSFVGKVTVLLLLINGHNFRYLEFLILHFGSIRDDFLCQHS